MRKISFFLPNLNCPERCIYCDQGAITGIPQIPSPAEVTETIRKVGCPLEICYFGGSFTCFPENLMISYLECVHQAPPGSRIRFSTHPRGISAKILNILKRYPISVVELGIASFDNNVLSLCHRSYDRSFILSTLSLLIREGFLPALQIMIGLPGQDRPPLEEGLRDVASMAPGLNLPLRLYPCLVLRGTGLGKLWQEGLYDPLSLEEAIGWAGDLIILAENLGYKVIRVGLHETPSLSDSVLAGPHHPALGEMARGQALARRLAEEAPQGPWIIPRRNLSMLTGHDSRGLKTLSSMTGLTTPEVRKRIGLSPSSLDRNRSQRPSVPKRRP